MSLHGGSVFSRLSKRSAISDTSPLAVHLGNDNAMRRLLRDGVGINCIQKKYLSLCYSSRPAVRPCKDVAQSLGSGELVWNLSVRERQETALIASLISTREAQRELCSLVISAAQTGCSSVRKRAGMARRPSLGDRWGARELAMERDPSGEVELFVALCKALPLLDALRSLELEGLRRAFEKSGAGAARLARGLKGNSNLKSLAVRHVRLADRRALGLLSSALCAHPSLVTLSLGYCDLAGEAGGRLAASVIRAHAARRDEMVWSSGLRRPYGVVGNTAAAAPARISTAGCLSMDMSGNRLGDAGVHAVARGLQSDTWLVGLNLSDNEATDRGAALLSVCLQHNATLCALVLDGNPCIGEEAERRITVELEARSMMPEAVLGEPEVVLTLASWGFSAHAGIDRGVGQPVAASDSGVSEISDDTFGGGGDRFRRTGAGNPSGTAATPAEHKEEMARYFRRWAGYAPHSYEPSSAPIAAMAAAPTAATDGVGIEEDRNAPGIPPALSLPKMAAAEDLVADGEATVTAAAQDGGPGGNRRGGDRWGGGTFRHDDRVRSLSSRSMARKGSGASGGVLKRSRSSGPSSARERARPPLGAAVAAAAAAAGRTRAANREPWGAGPRTAGARARAQAWASTHLQAGKVGGGGDGRQGGRGRNRRVVSGGGGSSSRSRVRGRRGRVAGGGSAGHKVIRRSAKTNGRKMMASRKARREAEMEPRRGTGRRASSGGAGWGDRGGVDANETRRRAASALDVTRDVLDDEDCPELPPRRRRTAGFSEMPQAVGGLADPRAVQDHERTERVINMLASLEKAVLDVCKEMWRLEDRVDEGGHLISQGLEERNVASNAFHESTGRGSQGDVDEGNANGDDDYLHGDRGREEVAAQVEACLHEMWREVPRPSPAAAADNSATGSHEGGSLENEEEEYEEEEGGRGLPFHSALLPEADVINAYNNPSELLLRRGELERSYGGGEEDHEARGRSQVDDDIGEEDDETLVFALCPAEDDHHPLSGGAGPGVLEGDLPVPACVGGEGWQRAAFERELAGDREEEDQEGGDYLFDESDESSLSPLGGGGLVEIVVPPSSSPEEVVLLVGDDDADAR